ncbi:PqqD family protein [Clostridium swellfunianum]|uniref:PqqD family protein n=1 Tax=Clostridium swellfunianum TaxID=1367462 RepID=UPI00202ED962|nr:PqqD family protein [Clostridium swellfunianum]MCM0650286.1 PqqD family protein [Clostridium swellfunianum]
MLFNKETQKENHKEDNFLLYIPRKKHDNWEVRKGKVYLIFHHDRTVERFARWLVKKPTVSDVELDEIGSKVWQCIDGQKTVYDIGEELKNYFGEKIDPVYDRLIMYLRYLNKKSWISFERGVQKEAN